MDRVRRRTSGWIWVGSIGLAAFGIAAVLADGEIRRAASRFAGVAAPRAPAAPRPPHFPAAQRTAIEGGRVVVVLTPEERARIGLETARRLPASHAHRDPGLWQRPRSRAGDGAHEFLCHRDGAAADRTGARRGLARRVPARQEPRPLRDAGADRDDRGHVPDRSGVARRRAVAGADLERHGAAGMGPGDRPGYRRAFRPS